MFLSLQNQNMLSAVSIQVSIPTKLKYFAVCPSFPTHSYKSSIAFSLRSPSSTHNQNLQNLLQSATPFLRGDLHAVDVNLPRFVSALQAAGAAECYHKHDTFLEHLIGVYRILKIWKAPDAVCLCGLFHSAYSNSYANNDIFPLSPTGRQTVRGYVGAAAERLIHLFCVVPRQPLIHDHLLFKYTDAELIEHLRSSEISVNRIRGGEEVVGEEESWRVKIQSLCPAEGIIVKHIKTGEDVVLSRRLLATFLLITMADFSEQFFSFQDSLFDNSDGRLEFSGNNVFTSLWPGDGKPGLWMNSVSRMGAIYSLIVREEEIYKQSSGGCTAGRDDELELVLPPVFNSCTGVINSKDQIEARDLYWEAVCNATSLGLEKAEEVLLRSVEKNPFFGEVHAVLAQVYMGKGKFELAEEAAERGLSLLLEWGSPWDKRITWQGWIAWCRVLVAKARQKSWPQNSWGILSLGLVK